VGTVSDVNVTLNGFTHSAPSDVDALLVGPTGQTLVLFGDAGQDIDVSGVTLTFDDAGSACLPQSSQIVGGTYKPCAAYDGTSFSAPAPSSPYGTTLAGFNGTDPNGTWKLFVYDDYAGDYGQFAGGWSVSFTTS
jgi:hypothetical protein